MRIKRLIVLLTSVITSQLAAASNANTLTAITILQAHEPKMIKLAPPVKPKKKPSIAMQDIEPFIDKLIMFEPDELSQSPIITDQSSESLISVAGDEIFVSRLKDTAVKDYLIVQPGKIYTDPLTKQVLGHGATILAEARLTQAGEPAAFMLTKVYQEVKKGDRLIPKPMSIQAKHLVLSKPRQIIEGVIIENMPGNSYAAKGSVVMLNKGEQAGLVPGAVLAVRQQRHAQKEIGELLIIKTFPQLSLGLITKATQTIQALDKVTHLP